MRPLKGNEEEDELNRPRRYRLPLHERFCRFAGPIRTILKSIRPLCFCLQSKDLFALLSAGANRTQQNWPDEACIAILKNNAEAMRGYDSRLLICDTVIPDRNSSLLKTMRDLKTIKLSGAERTVSDFRKILDAAGFCLTRTYALESPMQNVIEAVLKD